MQQVGLSREFWCCSQNVGALMMLVASTPRLTEFQQREGLQAIEMCKYYVFMTKGDIVKALHTKTAIVQNRSSRSFGNWNMTEAEQKMGVSD